MQEAVVALIWMDTIVANEVLDGSNALEQAALERRSTGAAVQVVQQDIGISSSELIAGEFCIVKARKIPGNPYAKFVIFTVRVERRDGIDIPWPTPLPGQTPACN